MGLFKDGMEEGSGILTHMGSMYQINFQKGKRHGKGVLTWENGEISEVEYF